jgi:RimJ/RimL family protein N-acetyltransferase
MLKGEKVGLRAIEHDDLPQLLEWRNRPEYRRFFREYREISMSQQIAWFESTVLKDSRTIMFSIVEQTSQRLLGACGLCYIDWVNRNADFSIYIGADDLYIDGLLAPDAALTMARYAFDELCMHKLWCEIYCFDKLKIKFFDNLGFTLDGRHRQTHWAEGAWHDSLFYGLLSDEFAKKHGKEKCIS